MSGVDSWGAKILRTFTKDQSKVKGELELWWRLVNWQQWPRVHWNPRTSNQTREVSRDRTGSGLKFKYLSGNGRKRKPWG